jgi:hypothetical protein
MDAVAVILGIAMFAILLAIIEGVDRIRAMRFPWAPSSRT